ncbi:hypothetical protein LEMLEM_LOCUS23883, partial [Lemmus lemmus]
THTHTHTHTQSSLPFSLQHTHKQTDILQLAYPPPSPQPRPPGPSSRIAAPGPAPSAGPAPGEESRTRAGAAEGRGPAAGECLAAPASRVSDWARRSPPSSLRVCQLPLAPCPLPGGCSVARPPRPPLLSHFSCERRAALSDWRAGRTPPSRTHARGPGSGVFCFYSRRQGGGGAPATLWGEGGRGRGRKRTGKEARGGGRGACHLQPPPASAQEPVPV